MKFIAILLLLGLFQVFGEEQIASQWSSKSAVCSYIWGFNLYLGDFHGIEHDGYGLLCQNVCSLSLLSTLFLLGKVNISTIIPTKKYAKHPN